MSLACRIPRSALASRHSVALTSTHNISTSMLCSLVSAPSSYSSKLISSRLSTPSIHIRSNIRSICCSGSLVNTTEPSIATSHHRYQTSNLNDQSFATTMSMSAAASSICLRSSSTTLTSPRFIYTQSHPRYSDERKQHANNNN